MQGKVLIIAGSDSGGGAGIQADIKAVTALNGFAMTAITALTAQNTQGVFNIYNVPTSFIAEQIKVVLGDIGADAIKIGMLSQPEIIRVVCDTLESEAPEVPIILDPVMVAKGGKKLVKNNSIMYLKKLIFPLCDIVTPNIPEAEALTGYSILDKEHMIKAAKKIINMGAKNVLLKGGHLKSKMIFDILISQKDVKIFPKRKIKTKHTHGTGCTLSSALATCLSQKKDIYKSCKISLRYVDEAISTAPGYGKGFGPLNHLVSLNMRNIDA